MTNKMLKHTALILFLFFSFGQALHLEAGDFVFTSVGTQQGLSDNQIRYILQLPDGRMVFTTSGSVNLYDGAQFTNLHRRAENVYPLKQYDGFYRIYRSGDSLLWIKDSHKLMCIDLYHEKYLAGLDAYFRERNAGGEVEDIFVDEEGRTWVFTAGELSLLGGSLCLKIADEPGKLQDVAADGHFLYLFYNTGELVCYDVTNGERLFGRAAYPACEQENFSRTSLVIKSGNRIYQLRNGCKGGCFYFDLDSRTWHKIFEQDYTLNTLVVIPGEKAYISCVHGFWVIGLDNGSRRYVPVLKTGKGTSVSTEISTVFYDRQGGLWVGSLNRGLLYYHPALYKLVYAGRNFFPVAPEEDVLVQAFAEDEKGHIFFRERTSIYRIGIQQDSSRKLIPLGPDAVSGEVLGKLYQSAGSLYFQNKSYTALCTDSRGWVWAGTADGLELFKAGSRTPRLFYRENGLANNFVQAILEDRRHDIWVTTGNGISRIHVDPESRDIGFVNYNQQDGALEGEYAKGAVFEASDGTLYFGGVDGFNLFQPENEPLALGLPYAPVFTALRLYGEKIIPGKKYGDRILLAKATPYTTELEMNHDQNFLSFEFSALNYLNRGRTYYRYQLEGIDEHWNDVYTGGQDKGGGSDGLLQASYTNLPPGNYTLRVMSSDNIFRWEGKVTEVRLTIHAPWWRTTMACVLYVILFAGVIVSGIGLYLYRARKIMERRHKEEILLLRIRNLIGQCNRYEAEQKVFWGKEPESSMGRNEVLSDVPGLGGADSAFLAQAIELVEKNMEVSGYSVEQLSRDLCMERTGLYRKLVTLLDQSPSLFIRNIRLRKAAQLLIEGRLTITEIAECTGFSSSSYLSKCFQERYGCRPSEYAGKVKNAT